jgi:hypothetical protein
MKRYLLLMPVIFATTAAIADTAAIAPSRRADAQAQAAALLSRPHTSGGVNADRGCAHHRHPLHQQRRMHRRKRRLCSAAVALEIK